METLHAVYQKDPEDPRFWLVHIAEDEGCHTFGRSFVEARERILDLASTWFERPVQLR